MSTDDGKERQAREHLHEQRRLLGELMRSDALAEGDTAHAVQQLTETACRLLDVDRASVWRLVDGADARIECVDLYDRRSALHEAGAFLFRRDVPGYFAAIGTERAIVTGDALGDARTSCLAKDYLVPQGIGAMLDAPVFVRGRLVAVVCIEHVGGPRPWKLWEELVAGTCADFVAQVLEAHGWAQAERALRDEKRALERKIEERTRALEASEAGLRTLLEVTPVALVLQRIADQHVLFVNERTLQLFELDRDELSGLDVRGAWVDHALQAEFLAAACRGRIVGLEAELRTRKGTTFWARISSQPMELSGQAAFLASIDDVSRSKATEAQLRDQATRDELTRVHNRRSLLELGKNELDRARRYERHFSAALIDLDRFKTVNDTHGHAAGDEVLKGVVHIAEGLLRGSDLLGRWGGDELVVLLPETDLRAATAVLGRVREAIERASFPIGDATARVTLSIGIAEWTGIEALEHLVERADGACYEAKRAGRNQISQAAPR